MSLVLFKRKFVSLAEVRFDPQADLQGIDTVNYLQAPKPIPGSKVEESVTLINDLTQDEQTMLNAMHKSTRYEVNRALKGDPLDYRFLPAPKIDQIQRYRDLFLSFASERGISGLSVATLKTYSAGGFLDMSEVVRTDEAENQSLSLHIHYVDKDQGIARLLHSAAFRQGKDTDLRALVGRANRFHHWKDMLRFKAAGYKKYDFGGWYTGDSDPEKLQINKFKQRFGGEILQTYNCEKALTLRGSLYLKLRRVFRQ